jgi:hypothetical protein
VVSNGLLLAKQGEAFWKNCVKNDIEVRITKYPIDLDFDEIKRIANKYGVKFNCHEDTDKVIKDMNMIPLDLNGTQNKNDSFRLCFAANRCINLRNGRLSTCSTCATISIFNNYFNTNLQESEADSIDIYRAKDIDVILDFLRKPIPFCRYCISRETITHLPWHRSKREISEWVVDN